MLQSHALNYFILYAIKFWGIIIFFSTCSAREVPRIFVFLMFFVVCITVAYTRRTMPIIIFQLNVTVAPVIDNWSSLYMIIHEKFSSPYILFLKLIYILLLKKYYRSSLMLLINVNRSLRHLRWVYCFDSNILYTPEALSYMVTKNSTFEKPGYIYTIYFDEEIKPVSQLLFKSSKNPLFEHTYKPLT